MRIAPLLFFCCVSALFSSSSAAQNRPLKEIVSDLKQVSVSDDNMLYDVPLAARSLLPEWKQGIRQTIVGVLSDSQYTSGSTVQLDAAIRGAFAEKGVSLKGDDRAYYGQLMELKVSRAQVPGLLAVTTTINIECGRDTSLYVFQKRNHHWELDLSYSAPTYSQIDGARENLDYRLSTLGDTSSWYALVAYSPPWCSSCWSALYYQVLRSTANPDEPEIVYDGQGGLYRCADKPFRLSLSPTDFSISYPSQVTVDEDLQLFTKVAVDRFSIRGGQLRRAPPRRQDAYALVDEWIELPEDQAELLVSSRFKDPAPEWHRSLSGLLGPKGTHRMDASYEWEQECAKDGSRWQVKLMFDPERQRAEPTLTPTYFTIAVTSEGIVLQRISRKPDSGCTGNRTKPQGSGLTGVDLP